MRLLTTVALLSALLSVPLAAQDDSSVTLVIQRDGQEIGRESFTLRDSRPRGVAGTILISAARYPTADPALHIATTLERTPEFALAKFQMDVDSAKNSTVILAAGSGARLIVRTVAKGSEAGRELPGGPDVVLLDDAVVSLYAQIADLATPAGRSLTAVFPRTGRRASFVARREQAADGNIQVVLSGGLSGTLLTDAHGRLVRLELPATKTVVTRLSDGP